jgi:hypothetical protein
VYFYTRPALVALMAFNMVRVKQTPDEVDDRAADDGYQRPSVARNHKLALIVVVRTIARDFFEKEFNLVPLESRFWNRRRYRAIRFLLQWAGKVFRSVIVFIVERKSRSALPADDSFPARRWVFELWIAFGFPNIESV